MDIQDVINDLEGNSLLLSHFSRSPFCDVCGIVSLIFQDYLLLLLFTANCNARAQQCVHNV